MTTLVAPLHKTPFLLAVSRRGRMVEDEAEHVWSGGQRPRVHSRGLGEAHLLGQVD